MRDRIQHSKPIRKSEINPVILEVKAIKNGQTRSKIKGNNQYQNMGKRQGGILWQDEVSYSSVGKEGISDRSKGM